MAFDPRLEIGRVITGEDMRAIFKCTLKGEMRRSLKTNTLILALDHTLEPDEYKWEDGVLTYSGVIMDNRDKLSAQEKILAESFMNGVEIHLFEAYEEKQYTYKGKVKLASRPYKRPKDKGGPEDGVQWMFPLKPVETAAQETDGVM